MKLRTFAVICLAAGAVLLAAALGAPLLQLEADTGIIGGAGMPTYRFALFHAMNGLFFGLALLGGCLVLTGAVCLLFGKAIRAVCTRSTTGIALSLSAVSAGGLGCVATVFPMIAFGTVQQYPIRFPVSIALGVLAWAAFCGLFALYIFRRKKQWSVMGMMIDVFTALIYLPAFFWILGAIIDSI